MTVNLDAKPDILITGFPLWYVPNWMMSNWGSDPQSFPNGDRLTGDRKFEVLRFEQLRGDVLQIERGQLWQLLLDLLEDLSNWVNVRSPTCMSDRQAYPVVDFPCLLQVSLLTVYCVSSTSFAGLVKVAAEHLRERDLTSCLRPLYKG